MSLPIPMRVARVPLLLLAVLLVGTPTAGADETAAIAAARQRLYTARTQSIAILEAAARRSPGEPKVWAEYVHALNVDHERHLAERAAQHALALHPRDPDVLFALARLRGSGGSLDVLAELAQVPGHGAEARRLAEWASLFMPLPDPQYQSLTEPSGEFTALWVDRLLVVGRTDRARAVIDESLKRFKGDDAARLAARRAVVLALDGKYDDALAVQHEAGNPQVRIEGSWFGLPDVLLAKGKADLAIAAFGGKAPGGDNDGARRIYARAKARAGDPAAARALLAGHDTREDRLLLLATLIEGKSAEDAARLGAQIVAPMEVYPGSYGGPWLAHADLPESLAPDFHAACKWLRRQFPDKREGIEFELGTGDEPAAHPRQQWYVVHPLSEAISDTEHKLATASAAAAAPGAAAQARDTADGLRRQLAYAYTEAARRADAARVLAPLASRGLPADEDASVDWVLARRGAEADVAARADFWHVAAARPLLCAPQNRRYNMAKVDGKDWPADREVVDTLVALGPAVLGDVLERLGPHSRLEDGALWVEVVGRLGSAGDAPVLIAALGRADEYAARVQKSSLDRRISTVGDVEAALEKLTHAQPPAAAQSGADRIAFWRQWWTANAARLIDPR